MQVEMSQRATKILNMARKERDSNRKELLDIEKWESTKGSTEEKRNLFLESK